MRVHIISDMEGVAGIVKPEQTSGGDPMYEEGRKLYTEEINAAVRGAKAAARPRSSSWTATAPAAAERSTRSSRSCSHADCDCVVQEEWTGYTGFLEEGCDAASSSACTRWPGRRTAS